MKKPSRRYIKLGGRNSASYVAQRADDLADHVRVPFEYMVKRTSS